MFDIGWSELLIIGIVALIVVGPKDLPGMFRALGRFTAKARGMAREFQRAMESAADDSGVKDIAQDLRKVANPGKAGLDAIRKTVSEATAGLEGLRDPLRNEPPRPAAPPAAPRGDGAATAAPAPSASPAAPAGDAGADAVRSRPAPASDPPTREGA